MNLPSLMLFATAFGSAGRSAPPAPEAEPYRPMPVCLQTHGPVWTGEVPMQISGSQHRDNERRARFGLHDEAPSLYLERCEQVTLPGEACDPAAYVLPEAEILEKAFRFSEIGRYHTQFVAPVGGHVHARVELLEPDPENPAHLQHTCFVEFDPDTGVLDDWVRCFANLPLRYERRWKARSGGAFEVGSYRWRDDLGAE